MLKFEGIDTINDALTRVGYSIYSLENTPPSPAENGPADLENFTVRDTAGDVWGKVTNLETTGLNELLEIRPEDGGPEPYYVPFTETIVKEINRDDGVIIIDPPDGLKDLNKK